MQSMQKLILCKNEGHENSPIIFFKFSRHKNQILQCPHCLLEAKVNQNKLIILQQMMNKNSWEIKNYPPLKDQKLQTKMQNALKNTQDEILQKFKIDLNDKIVNYFDFQQKEMIRILTEQKYFVLQEFWQIFDTIQSSNTFNIEQLKQQLNELQQNDIDIDKLYQIQLDLKQKFKDKKSIDQILEIQEIQNLALEQFKSVQEQLKFKLNFLKEQIIIKQWDKDYKQEQNQQVQSEQCNFKVNESQKFSQLFTDKENNLYQHNQQNTPMNNSCEYLLQKQENATQDVCNLNNQWENEVFIPQKIKKTENENIDQKIYNKKVQNNNCDNRIGHLKTQNIHNNILQTQNKNDSNSNSIKNNNIYNNKQKDSKLFQFQQKQDMIRFPNQENCIQEYQIVGNYFYSDTDSNENYDCQQDDDKIIFEDQELKWFISQFRNCEFQNLYENLVSDSKNVYKFQNQIYSQILDKDCTYKIQMKVDTNGIKDQQIEFSFLDYKNRHQPYYNENKIFLTQNDRNCGGKNGKDQIKKGQLFSSYMTNKTIFNITFNFEQSLFEIQDEDEKAM
ncbi:hypothetical protein PPERSA_06436 [Pseudocohnilembus persalinus]|uniref:Uncharacterized protein n=1 Tax=Pseudocohnilembus persalinus TaxID=266149 RepID=A0A0V0QR68_PSEPJ|nr:hypothetical protein PPERSA_06436 [Pseudocohnilembus persalinus]|eukprot:KRX04802.1 hypothetical protein PPERSA_06436 [Pseudocohnilembus persalinus]